MFQPVLTMPENHIAITADTKERRRHACGEVRLGQFFGREKIDKHFRNVLTQPCYEMEAGGQCTLTLSFYRGKKLHKPKGHLHLETNRGKLKPVGFELDGKKEKVKVQYSAPDETIRVSVRAFLKGFHRGKIHLHLE
ncbi:MAG: hypothetical protein ACFFCW_17280 [Candidatus Hodarchaeota archaeon]